MGLTLGDLAEVQKLIEKESASELLSGGGGCFIYPISQMQHPSCLYGNQFIESVFMYVLPQPVHHLDQGDLKAQEGTTQSFLNVSKASLLVFAPANFFHFSWEKDVDNGVHPSAYYQGLPG